MTNDDQNWRIQQFPVRNSFLMVSARGSILIATINFLQNLIIDGAGDIYSIPRRTVALSSKSEAYSESWQTSKMEWITEIVNGFQSLTMFSKHSTLIVWQVSEYASDNHNFIYRKKIIFHKIWGKNKLCILLNSQIFWNVDKKKKIKQNKKKK